MNPSGVLVRFGEVGIKSPPVRRQMLGRLQNNLLDGVQAAGLEGDVQILGSRLWMVGPDPDGLLAVATHTFGVVSASLALVVEADMDTMGAAASDMALGVPDWTSFAVRASREGKHDFSSQDVAIQVGSAVYKAAEAAGRSPQVNLGAPDLEVYVEVRDRRGYLYVTKVPGPGGLPLGSQGKVVALLSDANSHLAAWFMMRRGCRVAAVHAGDTGSVNIDGIDALARWGQHRDVDLLPVCSGTTTKAALLEAAGRLGRGIGAVAIVTGDDIESDLTPAAGHLPVLRPIAGLDPDEVALWMARVGGLEPGDDGDSLFADTSTETPESLLSMHRRVTV